MTHKFGFYLNVLITTVWMEKVGISREHIQDNIQGDGHKGNARAGCRGKAKFGAQFDLNAPAWPPLTAMESEARVSF